MLTYEQKHPLYAEYQSKRKVWSDIYEGGKQIKDRATTYLPQHPFESEGQYRIRLSISTYRNFAAPIVDVFSASINENRPPLVIPDQLDPMRTDCDRTGTDAAVFFGDVTRIAAAEGARFVLIDMPPTAGSTRGEDVQAGRRQVPYFVSIDADAVYDWGFGNDGALDWVTLYSERYEAAEPFARPKSVKQITLWTRNEWTRYEATEGQAQYVQVAEGTHPLGAVPLVPFLFEATSPMTGNSALDDVADLILHVFHLDSVRGKSLFDSGVPLLHAAGVSAEDMKEFTRSSSNAVCTSDPTARISYVETSGTSYDSQERESNATIASVREIAMRQLRAPSLSVESADAKRLDRAQLDSQLVRFAKVSQSAEEQCWKMAAKWLGLNVKPDDISAPYNTDFVSDDEKAAKLDRLLNLHREGVISKQTVRESEEVKAVAPEGWKPEDEIARLAQDVTVNGGPNEVASLTNFLTKTGI